MIKTNKNRVRAIRLSDKIWHKIKQQKPRGMSWDTFFESKFVEVKDDDENN